MTADEILTYIRNVPDFPHDGILFKDITTAIKEPKVFEAIIDGLAELVEKLDFKYIAAVESRGYIIGAPLAYKMNKGLIIIRKPGKLPAEVVREDYSLEYGVDSLEMHKDAAQKGDKVLVVDDLLATGGTVKAACRLIEKIEAKTVGCLFLLELTALSQHANLPAPIYSLIKC